MHAIRGAGRKLPVNLVFVAEGEEEIGSPHFPQIVQKPEVLAALSLWLIPAVLAHGVAVLIELFAHHPSVDAVRAARLIARGHYRVRFWGGVMAAGTVAPALLGWLGAWVHDAAALPAAVLALAGLWVWEDLWVKAGQSIPLS